MMNYTVVVYSGQYKETIQVKAVNQDNLKTRVRGLGYDRMGHVSKIDVA